MTDSTTVRILHTSDWQLGMTRWFLEGEAQARFTEDRIQAVGTLLQIAEDKQCDAVVVAGDVFDDNLLAPSVFSRTIQQLANAKVPVFLLPGNHDPLDASSVYHRDNLLQLDAITVLDDSSVHEVPPRAGGLPVEIVGAPLTSKSADEDLVAKALQNLDPITDARARVIVGHGAVSSFGGSDAFDVIDIPTATQACRDRIADYVALGDTHSTQALNSDETVWYSGSHEVTDFREQDGGGENNSGNVLLVEITVDADRPERQATVATTQIPVGTWTFQAVDAQVNSLDDVNAFLDDLRQLPNHSTTVIKYGLTGTLSIAAAATLDEGIDELKPGFAALYPRHSRIDVQVIPDDEEFSEGLLGQGFVGQAARELRDMAQSESSGGDAEQARIAQDALRLLLRLSHKASNS